MTVPVIYLFGHNTRNLTPNITWSRETLRVKTTGLLLRELEAEVLLADRWAHRTACAASSLRSSPPKHEPGSQLGTTCRSQNLALILLSESGESWGSKTLREGATVVTLLLAETIALDLAFFIRNGAIFGVLHHDTQVRSVGCHRVVVISGTN